MVDTPSTENLDTQKPASKPLAFIRFGLIEILFVATVLALFFGTLNYFNILSISKLNPQLFGRLPHKPYLINIGPISSNSLPIPTKTLSVTPLLAKAREDLPTFIKTSITTILLPVSFDIQSTRNFRGEVIDTNRFNIFWVKDNISAIASIRYVEKDKVDDKSISLDFPEDNNNITASTSSTLINQYVIVKTEGMWKCRSLAILDESSTICENFWVDGNGVKKGVGVISPVPLTEPNSTSIFTCELYPNGNFYNQKSCNAYIADTGV